jgi:D-alanine-D-alanine ligase
VPAYRVLGRKAQPGRARGLQGLQSPLIGRAEELQSLEAAFAGALELCGTPYTGSPPRSLALCLEKPLARVLLAQAGVRVPRGVVLERGDEPLDELAFPLIVKPLHEDGSLGIWKESVVYDDEALNRQIRYVVEWYRQPALIEEFIEGRELNVGLFETDGRVEVLPISEIDYSEFPEGIPKICGYEAKWEAESPEYQKSKPICPAQLEPVVQKRVEQIALKVFKLFGCQDYARVDMRLDPNGKPLSWR